MRRESRRAHEQQMVAMAIEVAQDCAREVRLLIDKRRDRGAARVIHSGASWTDAMQNNNDALGSRPPGRADWSDAFEAVSRLAAARDVALEDIGPDRQGASIPEPAGEQQAAADSATVSETPIASLDPDQLARAVAEIEKASSVLRQSDPALEVWSPNSAIHSVKRKYWSIWLLVAGIWLSATLVVAGATGAILYLLS
jgi:hypothetical protein